MSPELAAFIRAMPKVELHVHLEGAIRPETLLELARRNHVKLPSDTVEGLGEWYRFRDFLHFVEIYVTISSCLKSADDIELITREFLQGQAQQNIRHTEATYTALTIYRKCGIPLDAQLAALNRARAWAARELGVTMNLIVDIAREVPPGEGMVTARWVIENYGNGICALGLGGYEVGFPVEKFRDSFAAARAAGVPCILHAGETGGPDSIWSAIRTAETRRIGHGIACLQDPQLVAYLRQQQLPLEVCPTSNVRLNRAPNIAEHPIQKLRAAGLYVTLNSDDPAMFDTTLTDEYLKCADAFGWSAADCEQLSLNALRAALLPEATRAALERDFQAQFAQLRAKMSHASIY